MDLSSITSSLNSIPHQPFTLNNKLLIEKVKQENELGDEEQNKKQDSIKSFEFNNQTIDISMLVSFVEVADEYLSAERGLQLEYIRCTVIEAYSLLWPTTQEKVKNKLKEYSPILKSKYVSLYNQSLVFSFTFYFKL